MNPEEFDKRLSRSFDNENLPPDKKLWQNISARIDKQNKRSFWYWLMPAIVVLSALGGWLVNSRSNRPEQAPSALAANSGKHRTEIAVSSDKQADPSVKNTVTDNATTENQTNSTNIMVDVNEPKAFDNRQSEPSEKNGMKFQNQEKYKPEHQSNTINKNSRYRQPRKNTFLASYFQPSNTFTETDMYPTPLNMQSLIHPAITEFELEQESLIDYETPFKHKKTYKSPYTKNPVNFDSKWWWSAGIGPQITFNKAIIPIDSQAWVHRDLWSNKQKMTNNSSGFQSQLSLGHTLNKYFSVEAGLQYSMHKEDINFNFTSYSIETRDSFNKITAYQDDVYLWFIIKGSTDTTWYQAARGFSLAVKNRYSIFTIPVKFNFEYDISDKTKFFAGVGVGISAITSKKSTHLSLTTDKELVQEKIRQYTASLNAQFGFYTNFNDFGQLGIYSGFQMYTKPWELSNKQYAVKMSDLQLGICFRRPLNW